MGFYNHKIKPCPICTKDCPNIIYCVKSQMDQRNLDANVIQKLQDEIKRLKRKLVFEYEDKTIGPF